MYGCITGAALLHFRAATWWAWSSQMKILCITSQSTVLWLWWPWLTTWLLTWWCWQRRWLAAALRLNRIFLTLAISLHLACYSSDNKAYLINDNSHISTHSLCYRCQQGEQPDKHNVSNKVESRPGHYLPAQKLIEWQIITWSKTRYRSQNKE